MRLTYDPAADAAYLHLDQAHPPVTHTTPAGPLLLDWSGTTLIGIEVLDAATVLPQTLLDSTKSS
jgi:uncharacterized protein YuzE